ncbi:hypothetical protein [Mucilaginibacter psychrotolerans]|uniref:Uncharacterized protein n=1 Tax=Mucilaginibacter psychrotolerans TaxID=1524096 RepID=A0A4Y8S4N2_9SPHI|nr:hypothetical protein [Mucilaginibacter psychrotolerans]TFF33909.1 hypothetical protein E2R66_23820 [Mucilaginibacter psychrotolerans]
MKTTFIHKRGFAPQLSDIMYMLMCVSVLVIFILPLLVLLLHNLFTKPLRFSGRAKVPRTQTVPFLKLSDPL